MTPKTILLRYHEIALKGDNRSQFENRLAENARKMVQRASDSDFPVQVRRVHGRVLMEADWTPATQEALTRVFGLASFGTMEKVATDLDTIIAASLEQFEIRVQNLGMPESFCVRTRRSDKVFSQTSVDLDRIIGSAIREKYPQPRVDLKNAEWKLGIEIRKNETFLWTDKSRGPGGLPVGSNAPVLCLISGGLDSPVAAIQTLRRGCVTRYLHFYGTPFVGEDVLEKIKDLVRIVNRYQADQQPLLIVPFGKIQEKIALTTPPRIRTVLYRRMMMRIAEQVALRQKARALVTGESLGQVASQTVENLGTINAAAKMPILRPLITANKDDIIADAKKWGTYETSIRPGLDCCTLFSDHHPILRSTLEMVEEEEKKFSIPELIQMAMDGFTRIRV